MEPWLEPRRIDVRDGESFILTAGIPKSVEEPVSDRLEHVVLIEYKAKQQSYPDGSLFHACIEIRIKPLTGNSSAVTWGASFKRGFDEEGSVRLSNGFIEVPYELQGRRIGTWVMNEVVGWAKQWPNARVEPIRLQHAQASPDNKHRRNKFYNQFGLRVDLETIEGSSPTDLVAANLRTVKNPENINKVKPEKKIEALLKERDSLQIKLKNCELGRVNEEEAYKSNQKHSNKVWTGLCAASALVGLGLGLGLVEFYNGL